MPVHSIVSFNCSYIFYAVIASFQCKSYSVKEGDGICLPLKAAETLNRDFEVTMSLGKQFAAGLDMLNMYHLCST